MVKGADPTLAMSFDDVVNLLSVLDGSTLATTIDYRNGPLRVRIERGVGGAPGVAAPAVPVEGSAHAPEPARAAEPQAAPPTQIPAAPTASPTTPGPEASGPTGGTPVSAPVAGIFYRSPAPEAAPFVEVGQAIDEDTTIGIIEVMKLMNTVRSGVAGVVTEISATNAALVEYGQPLIWVREAGAG